MDLQLWNQLSSAISDVQRQFKPRPRDVHCTALIVRVHLWSVLRDRPTCWACEAQNWTKPTCPQSLPDQSTMSRRDAAWGRGVSRTAKGYKLHVIHSGNHLPDDFVITPLNTCEKQMGARMIKRVGGGGYLLGDAHYDASWLFDDCNKHNHQLVCPRPKAGSGLVHHPQSPHRLRAINLLESPAKVNPFGPDLYRSRTGIERHFSNLVCFGGGLTTLPPWVRRIWRVRRWVWGKLLVNAARDRIRCMRAAGA